MQTPARRLKLVQSATMEPLIPGLPDDVADQCLLRVAYDHLSLLDSVCRRWRHLLRSADFHTRRRRAGITRSLLVLEVQELEDEIYRTYATIFDSVSGTWRLLNRARAPDLYSIIRSKINIGVGRSMVAIGWPGLSSVSMFGFQSKHCGEVRIYDFHTGHCRAVAPIPLEDTIDLSYGAWNGASRVYVVYCDIPKAVEPVMCYDMKEDKWEVLTNAPAGRYTLAVGCYAGAFHRIRGSGSGKLVIDSLDESSGEWSVEVVEGVNGEVSPIVGISLGIRYAVGEDGKIYCGRGRKIRVKYQGQDG